MYVNCYCFNSEKTPYASIFSHIQGIVSNFALSYRSQETIRQKCFLIGYIVFDTIFGVKLPTPTPAFLAVYNRKHQQITKPQNNITAC